jgi:hypothetical protein
MTKKNISRALLMALVIGTMLNIINSYDVFMDGKMTGRNIIRIMLTYITPFCVSLYSSMNAVKQLSLKNDGNTL